MMRQPLFLVYNKNEMSKETYYIGGGTCCGKSSISDMLCEKHSLVRYSLDDDLYPFIQRAADEGSELAAYCIQRMGDRIWLRPPEEMCAEEMELYRLIFPYAQQAIENTAGDRVLAEGAGFLPGLVSGAGVRKDRYICMAPTAQFQWDKYSRRGWVQQVLEGIMDKQQAFANWMQRDVLFARQAMAEAQGLGYATLLVDGLRTLGQNLATVERVFGL